MHLVQFNNLLKMCFESNEQLRSEHLERVNQILSENQVEPTNVQLDIVKYSSLDTLKEPPSHSVIVNLENRLLISGGIGATGAVTGAIAGKVTAKVARRCNQTWCSGLN